MSPLLFDFNVREYNKFYKTRNILKNKYGKGKKFQKTYPFMETNITFYTGVEPSFWIKDDLITTNSTLTRNK